MIILPRPPRDTASLTYISNAVRHQPTHGGSTKLINRLGDRFAYTVNIKARGDQGAAFVARLNAGRSQLVRMPVNQPFDIQRPAGQVTVANSVSGGTTITLTGLGSGYVMKSGQMVSIIAQNGKSYLHQIVDQATANASGAVNLTVTPAVRTTLTVGDLVEVNLPIIEGYLEGSVTEWTTDFLKIVTVGFQIAEAE